MLWDFYERIGEVIARPEIDKVPQEDLKLMVAELSRMNADLRRQMGLTPKNWITGDKTPAKKKAVAKRRAKK